MLIYEHKRTKDLITRMVALGNIIRLTSITLFVVLFGTLLTLLARLLVAELWWLGGLYGVLIGFGLGVYASSLLTITLEWMAQSLVAQGEILATLKKDAG